jgi:dTDP-4-dehydrorhamnose 3,5-epimerase
MIEDVVISERRQFVDERGKIMHFLRKDDPEFLQFGEIYFSWINPGAVKGWHNHREMTLFYVCPYGQIKVVLYDDRAESTTRGELMEVFLGPDCYRLLRIPPGVWNGFKGIAVHPSLVCDCATIPHDPAEIERADPHSGKIPYDWRRKDR